jgi:hypothetical protein
MGEPGLADRPGSSQRDLCCQREAVAKASPAAKLTVFATGYSFTVFPDFAARESPP